MRVDHNYVVGVDIAAATIAVSAVTVAEEKQLGPAEEFANTRSGYQALQRWLSDKEISKEDALVVMEATGVYWEECALTLHEGGWQVRVVNPAQTRHYARCHLRRSKTDRIDAFDIARFACNVRLREWNPPDLYLEELQLMMRQRAELVAIKTQETNRLHALERRPRQPQTVIKVVREHIHFLEKRIGKLEGEFKKALKKHPEWQKMMDIMTSVPGIGFVTAAVFLTESGAFASFVAARQLSAYAGIAPASRQSGSSVKGPTSISKMGNKRLRCAAYLAAVTASQWNLPLMALYQRLIDRGKTAKSARVAVARKLLELAFTLVTTGQMFDPQYALNSHA